MLHHACAIGSDIYVFGGKSCNLRDLTSVVKFDTETDTWSTLEPMPLSCPSGNVSVLDGDQIYIVGAGDDGKGVMHFDTTSGVWSTLGATTNDKHSSASFVIGGCLYVAGGGLRNTSFVDRYDVATDTWTAVADTLEGRAYSGAVTVGSADPAELFDSLIAKAT
jgi:N-acetylneuraminic acid mutarotase